MNKVVIITETVETMYQIARTTMGACRRYARPC